MTTTIHNEGNMFHPSKGMQFMDDSSKFIDRIESHFSFFSKPISNLNPLKDIDLPTLHEVIVSDKYKAATEQAREILEVEGIKAYKRFKSTRFDYVSFNGTFTTRADNGIIQPSGLFIIDVDHIGENLPTIFERLKLDTIITPVLVFVSPSGDGLKIVVCIDVALIKTDGKNRMQVVWDAVNSYFAQHYSDLITPNEKGDFIDGACKDLSRPCFICHDANAYLRESEPNVLAQSFVDSYIAVQADETTSRKSKKKADSKRVSPKTTIADLRERHLLSTDNHTPQLLSFITACMSIGIANSTVHSFIVNHVHISPDSSKADPTELENLINDLYGRYGNASGTNEAIMLTPKEFAYGIIKFAYDRDSGKYLPKALYMDGIRSILDAGGFHKRSTGNNNFIYIKKDGCIIEETTTEIMQCYVQSLIGELIFTYQNTPYSIPETTVREVFLNQMQKIFKDEWATCLNENKEIILKDTESEMVFCFKNGIVKVTKEGINVDEWSKASGFVVWKSQIIEHNFSYVESYVNGVWYQFLCNVCNGDANRIKTMFSAIGYLMHHYFKESEGQAVVLYDEAITDLKKPQGGSGKGLIVNGIKQLRNTTKIDGKHLEANSRFKFEQVKLSTQVIWLDDVKPDFDFTLLFSNLTDGWTIERKFQSQILIPVSDSPKTVICSNSIIKGDGSSNTRRRFELELSDFYSKQLVSGNEKPIEKTHGGIFFSKQWSADEWNMFFSVMMDAAYLFIKEGLVPFKGVNLALNRFRQSVGDDFAEWVETSGIVANNWYDTKDYYNKFIQAYYGESAQKIGQRKFTDHLKAYAEYKQLKFDRKESNGNGFFILSVVK